MRVLPFALLLACVAHPALGQDALRGKVLYHDIGRLSGSGVSCIDCHGGVPGALYGLGKVADNPAAIAYAIGAISQMEPLRGWLTAADMADIAAYVARPSVPSPDPRVTTSGPASTRFAPDRLEFAAARAGTTTVASEVRITNAGAIGLNLAASPVLAGPSASEFTIAATDCRAPMSLASGQSCTVSIVFEPVGEAGPRAATLRLAHDWIRGAVNVPLIGEVARRD